MVRGKYADRADARLRVLESEALREATAKICGLELQLKQTQHELKAMEWRPVPVVHSGPWRA
jgi:hypothetical protein